MAGWKINCPPAVLFKQQISHTNNLDSIKKETQDHNEDITLNITNNMSSGFKMNISTSIKSQALEMYNSRLEVWG
jgi:hypothetical protein